MPRPWNSHDGDAYPAPCGHVDVAAHQLDKQPHLNRLFFATLRLTNSRSSVPYCKACHLPNSKHCFTTSAIFSAVCSRLPWQSGRVPRRVHHTVQADTCISPGLFSAWLFQQICLSICALFRQWTVPHSLCDTFQPDITSCFPVCALSQPNLFSSLTAHAQCPYLLLMTALLRHKPNSTDQPTNHGRQ